MGPLEGVKVVEIASIGPGPWCAMMLSDMGAEVIRVDRADHVREHASGQRPFDFVNRRGRRSVGVDLKHRDGAEVVLRLAERADALIEGSLARGSRTAGDRPGSVPGAQSAAGLRADDRLGPAGAAVAGSGA